MRSADRDEGTHALKLGGFEALALCCERVVLTRDHESLIVAGPNACRGEQYGHLIE